MDQTSAPANAGAAAIGDTTSVLTSVHLVWLAVLAVLVIVGILYGARAKRRRDAAERRMVEHAAEAGVEPQPAGEGEAREEAGTAAATPAKTPPPPTPASVSAGDEAADGPVTQLKGLGPKVAARLAELGVTNVGQLAALDHDGAQALDAQLGPFRGRLERDRWIEQARFLAAGDRAGFEAVFGRL